MRANYFALTLILMLVSCSPQEPVKLGFLGGLSGRVADLGEAGRSGALLAVEEANAAGGMNGRKIILLADDDAQNAETAIKAVERMLATPVDAIIGPMTSSMAEAILPLINRSGVVVVSPTITVSALSGIDDTLFKVAPSVGVNTQRSASHLFALGTRRMAIVYDLNNRAYTEDWAKHYRRDFTALGGAVVAEASFTSGADESYGKAMRKLAAAKPDALLFIANAVDTVRLTQLSRNLGMTQRWTSSTWAATENLMQLGGRTVEGMTMTQFFNRDDTSPRYLAFAEAFRARFKQEPGFASLAGYDATRATLQALSRVGKEQTLKQALLTAGPYEGLQERWNFNRYGDAERQTYLTVVRNGRFVIVK